MEDGSRIGEVADGIWLLLGTQSFAVRALLGSLAAAALAALAVRFGLVRSARARRILVLAPIGTAAAAAVASAGGEFLPQLRVAASGEGPGRVVMDFLGLGDIAQQPLDVFIIAYAAVAGFLVLRRLLGLATVGVLVRTATPARDERLRATAIALAGRFDVRVPRLLLLARCPGGAFTTGLRQPVLVVDPELLVALDDHELEGLVAHELAHIARRDTQLGLVVGLVRDLTFFLPPLSLALRWLRNEQEEGADDLASERTHRPVALASSILKVWDCSSGRRRLPSPACAAIGSGSLRLAPAGGASLGGRHARGRSGEAARAVTVRVERLIARLPSISVRRRRAETAFAAAVLAVATAAAVVLPAQLPVQSQVALAYQVQPVVGRVEAPAFATFRDVTAEDTAALDPSAADRGCSGCLLVESRVDLSLGQVAAPPARASWWQEQEFPWLREQRNERLAASEAQELWGVSGSGSRLGVYLVTNDR